ncbi:uncharacterized protein LOC101856550 [Aplysia californica]|uniref:Uncharacterized protein LOC101856550 n=1 Tax=Aplysia californica TaxID=6500 RepID=A0ABM1W3J3_APLCA|nr:uncharacterized protein LOC101856550 [Aplysia californica]
MALMSFASVLRGYWDVSGEGRDLGQAYRADWNSSFEENYTWNTCQTGYFLQGLSRTGKPQLLENIEPGWCAKPPSHPHRYGHCYVQDISDSFNDKGVSECRDMYFITGLFRGGCNELHCIEKMMCCRMAAAPEPLNSLRSVKTKVMEDTVYDVSRLADHLGYVWYHGSTDATVGEDFRRVGDTWSFDSGDRRFNMSYDNWRLTLKSISYGEPELQKLPPGTIGSGLVRNTLSVPIQHRVQRVNEVVRSVTHIPTSEWTNPEELNVKIGYIPEGLPASSSYDFTYQMSSSTEDCSQNQQKQTFVVESVVNVLPDHALNWTLTQSRTRRTVHYNATILTHFSTALEGFLRLRQDLEGSETSESFTSYSFGDGTEPFCKALKEQSDSHQGPWRWAEMRAQYGSAQAVINSLSSEGRYEFTLTGTFEDVYSNNVQISWDKISHEQEGQRSLVAT